MNSFIPVLIIAGLILWTWGQQRLRSAAQPLRLELAKRGEKLLGDPELPRHLHSQVEFLLENTFGNRGMLLFGLVAVPVIMFFSVIEPKKFQGFLTRTFTINNSETQLAYEKLNRLYNRIMFANHPILNTVLDIEIAIFVKLSLTIVALIYGNVPANNGPTVVKAIIEAKEQEYMGRFRTSLKAA